jgi:hypothetical protein
VAQRRGLLACRRRAASRAQVGRAERVGGTDKERGCGGDGLAAFRLSR